MNHFLMIVEPKCQHFSLGANIMSARKCFWVWIRFPVATAFEFPPFAIVLLLHGIVPAWWYHTIFRGDLESNSWRKNEFNLDPLPSGVVCVAIYSKPV